MTATFLNVPPTCTNSPIDAPCASAHAISYSPPLFYCQFSSKSGYKSNAVITKGPYHAFAYSETVAGIVVGMGVALQCPKPALTDVGQISGEDVRMDLDILHGPSQNVIKYDGVPQGNQLFIPMFGGYVLEETPFSSIGEHTYEAAGMGGYAWVLVVGGGGAGGGRAGGGGGGGAVVEMKAYGPLEPGEKVKVVVGAGGAKSSSVAPNNPGTCGENGADSKFGSLVAKGGGGGAGDRSDNVCGRKGRDGGNGGGTMYNYHSVGGASTQASLSGDSAAYGHGYPGAAGTGNSPYNSGGGGGAGGPGISGGTSACGAGGKGYTALLDSKDYGGGGGGGSHNPACSNRNNGGEGGGGNIHSGGGGQDADGGDGTNGLGGGGAGGASNGGNGGAGGAGGSGMVIVKCCFKDPLPQPSMRTLSTGSTKWTAPKTGYAQVLLVAGGGAGGGRAGGGGGGGGVVEVMSYAVTKGKAVDLVVGAGGTKDGTRAPNNPGTMGNNGADTKFGDLIAKGGGGGSGDHGGGKKGKDGGSGGGTMYAYHSTGGSATQGLQSGDSGKYGQCARGCSNSPP